MRTFTLDEILNLDNRGFQKLELTLSEEEKELIIEQVREHMEQRAPEEEFLHDYIEVRNEWMKLNHKMDYPEAEALREAILSSFTKDWKSCRIWLDTYFSHYTPEMVRKLDISKWDYRHILKWFQMLINTDLYKGSEGSTAHAFFLMIFDEGTIVRPSELKTKFEKEVKQSCPELDGLEALIRDTIHIVR